MLTQLSTVKARLAIPEADVTYDAVLTDAIRGFSARFDCECNRTLARTVDATWEFPGSYTHLLPPCYPIETISRLELKTSESEGWVEQTGIEMRIRRGCVVSLGRPLGTWDDQGRIVYTGGYVLPGAAVGAGQAALPADLEQAIVEQVAFWYQTRNSLGLVRSWPTGGDYRQFADPDLLPGVRSVLKSYSRMTL